MRTRTIRQKVTIHARPDEVYEAFMDPARHGEFTESEADGSSEVGGVFHAYGGYITARNLQLEQGRLIVQEWTTSEWPEGYGPSRLEMRLKPVKGGTELEFVQTEVPAEQADDYDQGWHDSYWNKMNRYFASRRKGKK